MLLKIDMSSFNKFLSTRLINLIPLVLILFIMGCERQIISPSNISAFIISDNPSPVIKTVIPITTAIIPVGQHAYTTTVIITVTQSITKTEIIHYLLFLPGEYGKDITKRWPLILYLHGSGERGTDLNLLKTQPLPKTLEQQKDFPFIVISPQLINDGMEWSPMIRPLIELLKLIQRQYLVDQKRIYLTGVSMGGFGTWEFALRYPDRFAAIVPIAGGYIYQSNMVPANICDLKELPIWVFHGGLDDRVLPIQSEVLINALKECNGDIRFTIFPDLGHNVWNQAYADPEVWRWLLLQTIN